MQRSIWCVLFLLKVLYSFSDLFFSRTTNIHINLKVILNRPRVSEVVCPIPFQAALSIQPLAVSWASTRGGEVMVFSNFAIASISFLIFTFSPMCSRYNARISRSAHAGTFTLDFSQSATACSLLPHYFAATSNLTFNARIMATMVS